MRIIQLSLGSTPEEMLKTSLESCITIGGATGGSILGEEGPHLVFLFSDVKSLIGMVVPFDSIAGITVEKNVAIYTYAPSDSRHFAGVDERIKQVTKYLLSIPIPSIHTSNAQSHARNAGVLQLLFDSDVLADTVAAHGGREFGLDQLRTGAFYDSRLKGVFGILPLIAFGMEVMRLRQTSYQTIHELKNKMIAGLSWLNNMRQDIEQAFPGAFERPGIKDDFDLSAGAIKEGAELAKNYLQFTKLYEPHFRTANLADVLSETAATARTLGNSLGLKPFYVQLDLPQNDPLPMEIDPDQMKMALFNLAKNAIEAMHSTGVANPSLLVIGRRKGDGVEVVIADSGPGMPKEIADNLFVPFKTRKEGGTGLGLSITKKIIDIHGGIIRCETGQSGTSFRISL